jgi:hypothetical protein
MFPGAMAPDAWRQREQIERERPPAGNRLQLLETILAKRKLRPRPRNEGCSVEYSVRANGAQRNGD